MYSDNQLFVHLSLFYFVIRVSMLQGYSENNYLFVIRVHFLPHSDNKLLVMQINPGRFFYIVAGYKFVYKTEYILRITKRSKVFYRIDFASLRNAKCIIIFYVFFTTNIQVLRSFMKFYEVLRSIHTKLRIIRFAS